MSDFTRKNILFILGAVFGLYYGFKKFYATAKGRVVMDDFTLKLPVFGMLIRKVAVAKFTRTMSTMLTSGVAILDALDIVAKTAGTRH